MAWQIRKVEWDQKPKQVGDAWYIPEFQIKVGKDGRRWWFGHVLTDDYERNKRGHRQPIAVMLPSAFGGIDFCVDSDATDGGGGWQVSGDLPNLTVAPSINIYNIYHGFIQGGTITDDCEGRHFE